MLHTHNNKPNNTTINSPRTHTAANCAIESDGLSATTFCYDKLVGVVTQYFNKTHHLLAL